MCANVGRYRTIVAPHTGKERKLLSFAQRDTERVVGTRKLHSIGIHYEASITEVEL